MKKTQETKQKKTVKITQIKSSIGRNKNQKKNLLSLGLKKIGQTSTIVFNNSTSGLIQKINNLIKVEDNKKNAK
ncbi:MAG: hypothetical protein CFH23_00089 [Alphaproteobacteria bacterium MarineAlpha6_Bin1]|nr:MAG: hypothetical protein CFH23_00089 [Alphaproteobacteria bacterium MarineAlpha6_Bin1]